MKQTICIIYSVCDAANIRQCKYNDAQLVHFWMHSLWDFFITRDLTVLKVLLSAICAFNYTNPWFTYVKSLLSDKNINRQIKDPLIFIITSIRFIQFHSRLIYISVWEFEYKTQWTMRIYMYDHIYVYAICYIYPYAVKTHTHKTPHVGAGGWGVIVGFFFNRFIYSCKCFH